MLGSIFTWHALSPYVFVLLRNLGPPQSEAFSEVVAVVPKFHYLITATTECVTKLEYFLKRNF